MLDVKIESLLEPLKEALVKARWYRDGELRPQHHRLNVSLSVGEAMRILHEVFGIEPACRHCGK